MQMLQNVARIKKKRNMLSVSFKCNNIVKKSFYVSGFLMVIEVFLFWIILVDIFKHIYLNFTSNLPKTKLVFIKYYKLPHKKITCTCKISFYFCYK